MSSSTDRRTAARPRPSPRRRVRWASRPSWPWPTSASARTACASPRKASAGSAASTFSSTMRPSARTAASWSCRRSSGDRVMAINFDAAYWLSRACLPGMIGKGWGRIINFAGMNAIHGYNGRARRLGLQARRLGPDQGAGQGIRAEGHHHQHRVARPDHGRGAGCNAGGAHQADAGARASGPARYARGGGCGRCLARIGSRRLHQRPAHSGQRRRGDLTRRTRPQRVCASPVRLAASMISTSSRKAARDASRL